MTANARVRQAMTKLAQSLSRPSELGDTLLALTRSACETIPGIDYASINILHSDGRLETLGATDPIVVQLDELQAALSEGPCYDAADDRDMYLSEDLQRDPRWPAYGPKAAAMHIEAQMGLTLPTGTSDRAALNLYAREAGTFGDAADLAEMFAASAGITLGFARTLDTLTVALRTRTDIGKAMGIVMERYAIDSDRAFRFLVRVSQKSETRLPDVAADVVASIAPGSPPTP